MIAVGGPRPAFPCIGDPAEYPWGVSLRMPNPPRRVMDIATALRALRYFVRGRALGHSKRVRGVTMAKIAEGRAAGNNLVLSTTRNLVFV